MSTDDVASSPRPSDSLPTFKPLAESRSPRNGTPSSASDDSSRRRRGKDTDDRDNSPGRLRAVLQRQRSKRIGGDARDDSVANDQPKGKKQRLSSNFLLHPFSGSVKKRESLPSVNGTSKRDGSKGVAQSNGQDSSQHQAGEESFGSAGVHVPDGQANHVGGASSGSFAASTPPVSVKGKERLSMGGYSPGLSTSSPSSSRHGPANGFAEQHDRHFHGTRHTSADVDPSQIVRMALTLNESRRLGLSPGQLPLGGPSNGRRAASAGLSVSKPPLLDGQIPRQVSSAHPMPGDRIQAPSPNSGFVPTDGADSRPPSSSPAASRVSSLFGPLARESAMGYDVSPATMLRAEKARAYFELCHEYRRLMNVLPPLSPKSNRGATPVLGRPYNPLQYIRNRRLRARERQNLDGAKTGWDQVETVDKWVNLVELDAKESTFYDGDVALLPHFESTSTMGPPDSVAAKTDPQARQSRLEWRLDPADLLADAYWLEQDRHKTLIEDRHGAKLFEDFAKPTTSRRSRALTRGTAGTDTAPTDGIPTEQFPTIEASEDSDVEQSLQMYASKRNKKPKKARRNFLGRRRTMSSDGSFSSASDDKSIKEKFEHSRRGSFPDPNVGPLEKHMNMMMQREGRSSSIDSEASLQPTKAENSRGQLRRGGVSTEYSDPFSTSESRRRSSFLDTTPRSPRSSIDVSTPGTPRISIDDYDRDKDGMNGHALSPTTSSIRKRKAFPLGFMHRRGNSKRENMIAESDFAVDSTIEPRPGAFDFRRSVGTDGTSASSSRRHSHDSSADPSDDRRRSDAESKANGLRTAQSATTRFFKGGRIGELVKNEASPKSDVIWKAEPPRKGSKASDVDTERKDVKGLFAPREHRRSRSTNDLQGQYHTPDLPTFKSSNAPQTDNDHVSRQHQETQAQKQSRKSRFDRLSPISTISTPEVSPNTSQVDLGLQETKDSSRLDKPSVYNSSRASSAGLGEAGRRLSRALALAGDAGHTGLPPTGLSAISANRRDRSRHHRDWNIAEEQDASSRRPDAPISAKDIAYVRTLLLSSGIKAVRIVSRANENPTQISPFLLNAYSSANQTPVPASKREEHVVAARILSKQLSQTVSDFESSASAFRSTTCADLHSKIDTLRERIAEQLTPSVRTCTDEADALIAKLTTSHNLAVKQVNDSVEQMMRRRWRRLRKFRRAGFKMLECVVVGMLWLIWGLVLIIRVIRAVVMGLVRGVKWMIWM